MSSSGVQTCADRKSTRLNSSHTIISYAVFCLKKICSRSEEYTSELQSHDNLVCRLLLAKTNRDTLLGIASGRGPGRGSRGRPDRDGGTVGRPEIIYFF